MSAHPSAATGNKSPAPGISPRTGDLLVPIRGITLGSASTALTGLAPGVLLAAAAQAAAGVGNTLDLVGTDTLIQRVVPPPLPGRAFGAGSTAAQAGSGLAYAAPAFVVAAA